MEKTNKINRITLLMAMQDEASPLIDALGLTEQFGQLSKSLPFRHFSNQKPMKNQSGSQPELIIDLITSGIDHRHQVDNIGCEAATLMAYEAINKTQPELIISAGTAGGFSDKEGQIGLVYASHEYFVFHDRIVPLPGFHESAIGQFPALPISKMVDDLGLACGVISTGSSLEKNDKDNRIIKQHDVVAKEMEAAAIAWVCMLHQTPLFAIKSITNLVDQDNQSETEFVENFDRAVASLTKQILRVLKYLENKQLAELD